MNNRPVTPDGPGHFAKGSADLRNHAGGDCSMFQSGLLQSECGRRMEYVLVLGVFAASVIGCQGEDGPPLLPVSGVVMLGGQPLKSGSVSFRDDSGLVQPTGPIEDGKYELILDRRLGAPAGRYKVVVFATESRQQSAGHGGLPRLIINKKFTDPKTTPLEAEVMEGAPPGAYDFEVTK